MLMLPEEWHKEQWIKDLPGKWANPREKFVEWCAEFKKEYTAEEAGTIYDSHVLPKEPAPVKPKTIKKTDPIDSPDGE